MNRHGPGILVVDIGNTSTTVGMARGRRILRTGRLPSTAGGDSERIGSFLQRLTRSSTIEDAVLCSVVPRLNSRWRHALNRLTGSDPLLVTHRIRMNVKVDYPEPASIGADRLANAVGAWDRYGCPVVVADFGTALTFDVVTGDARYIGGVIAPGLPLMTEYLCERTALLPPIRLSEPTKAIGRSTREAMCIGAIVGYRGLIREILGEVVREMNERGIALCATGGYAAHAVRGLRRKIDVLPNLTLEGLVLMRELNRA